MNNAMTLEPRPNPWSEVKGLMWLMFKGDNLKKKKKKRKQHKFTEMLPCIQTFLELFHSHWLCVLLFTL